MSEETKPVMSDLRKSLADVCEKHHTRLVPIDCRRCHGTGELDDPDDWEPRGDICWICNGTGEAKYLECPVCIEESEHD